MPEIGVSVLRIRGPLPFGAKPIELLRQEHFDGLPRMNPRDGTGVTWDGETGLRALATVGFGSGTGFSLYLNHLVGATDMTRSRFLLYTHVTQPGASGAPVFDVETGELVAVHQNAYRDSGLGSGISIPTLIAAIEVDLEESP